MLNNADIVAQNVVNLIAEKVNNLKTLNIIVAGKTGVGKSTLINATFRENLAEIGIGKPVTDHMRKISKNGFPLSIYDTRGFELGKEVQTQVKQEVIETIKKGYESKNINNIVHCIWYCINSTSNRVEPEELEWLKELSKDDQVAQVPIIVILTQSISKKSTQVLRNLILNENLNIVQVVPVLAEDYFINDEYIVKSYGLEELIKVMGESLPDELIDTLQNVQKASLAEKQIKAHAIVASAMITAAGEGAIPIPFADCAVLIPTQIAMITSITMVFGLEVNQSIITAFLSSTIGAGGATLLGKTIVQNLVKLIPGIGTVIGGAISAGTAGVLTAALGEAYIGIMNMIYNGEMSIDDLSTKKGKEQITTMFTDSLKKEKLEFDKNQAETELRE